MEYDASTPPRMCAKAFDKNQSPISKPANRTGAILVTIDNPTGERQSSPVVCNRYVRMSKSMLAFRPLDASAPVGDE